MTPDGSEGCSPRSARSVQRSLGAARESVAAATPPGDRDVLAQERMRLQMREEEINHTLTNSMKKFDDVATSQKKKKKKEREYDYFDDSNSSSVNRALDYDGLNTSTLSAYDADSELVESGAEQQRRRGTRLPRASIAPGATRIPEPSQSGPSKISQKKPVFKPAPRASAKAMIPQSSGSIRTRRQSMIPPVLNTQKQSKKPIRPKPAFGSAVPRGDLI